MRRQVSRDNEGRCPGETACSDFQRTAPPKSNACRLCPLLPTKPIQIQRGSLQDMALRIERMWQERRSGRVITPDQMSPLEFEGLIVWQECEDQYRYAFEDRVARACEIIGARLLAQG